MSDPFGRRVRSYTYTGKTYFDLFEAAYVLRAGNVERLAANLDSDEVCSLSLITGNPKDATTIVVTEPGIYKIAIRMQRPEARLLLRFVCHHVLPSLSNAGSYRLPKKGEVGADMVQFMRKQLEGEAPVGASASVNVEAKVA